ncbi:XRE family transcriptional regulator [Parablautia intestinalis]|uniref:XRE family transcriptional regulator n=1 Tax=Parablautia intestinalis TaxID=2320100 RepID=A0A3A9B3K4_9FIRM|nr:helix-turn-helix transcriptional regulator [Parablautia intestinalis]RKI94331.1 XRE family transcriptional regulator [Parablautia intestinalis]
MVISNEKLLKENIQKNIAFYRKKLKMTQKGLAGTLGVTAAAISSWECGNNSPDIDTLCAICNALDVGLYEICGISSDNTGMSAEENDLLNLYRLLNEDGQRKLIERANELRELGYIKGENAKMA